MDVEDLIASMHVGREGYELKALQVSWVLRPPDHGDADM
jgi:hypothetical protein